MQLPSQLLTSLQSIKSFHQKAFEAVHETGEQITSVEFSASWNAFETDNFAYSVTAVPEPESYAMMLAGLGLMGAIARRRSQSKSD